MPVPELQEFRSQYPAYNDVPDGELAASLAQKYPAYSDLVGKVRADKPSMLSKVGAAISPYVDQLKSHFSAEPAHEFSPSGEDVARVASGVAQDPNVQAVAQSFPDALRAIPEVAHRIVKPAVPFMGGKVLPDVVTVPLDVAATELRKIDPRAANLLEAGIVTAGGMHGQVGSAVKQLGNLPRYKNIIDPARFAAEPEAGRFAGARDVTPAAPQGLPAPIPTPIENAQIVSPGLTEAAAARVAAKRGIVPQPAATPAPEAKPPVAIELPQLPPEQPQPSFAERSAAAQAAAAANTERMLQRPLKTDQQAVRAAADEKVRQITGSEGDLEYGGKTYTGAVQEGNNVRLKDTPDKVVRGVDNILKIDEKVPFDIPPETPVETAQRANEAATSLTNDLPQPSEAQIKAGNYKKGHVNWNGFDISVENPKDSVRTGTDANGQPWEVNMPAHYGYLRRTKGADGEQVDIYLGEKPSDKVFVVDQIDANTGKFDEHKVIGNVGSIEEAQQLYDAGFSDQRGPERRAAISEMSIPEFKEWVDKGDTKKPVAAGEKPAPPMFEQTAAGQQAVLPGAETRSVPNAPLRAKRAQTEKPLDLEQPGIQAKEPGLFENAPPASNEVVRLYRGQTGKSEPISDNPPLSQLERGRWFTTDKDLAQFHGKDVHYVDVPKDVADASIVPDSLFNKSGRLLPAEWANKAQPEASDIAMTKKAAPERPIPSKNLSPEEIAAADEMRAALNPREAAKAKGAARLKKAREVRAEGEAQPVSTKPAGEPESYGFPQSGTPAFISRQRKQELADLGHSREEISKMSPAEADKIVAGEDGALGFPEIRKSPADVPQNITPLERNFQPPSPAEKVEIVRRGDIIRRMSEALQLPIRSGHGNFAQKKAAAFFKVKEEVVRTKFPNDVESTSHEVGHFISKKFFKYAYSTGKKKGGRSHAFDGELNKMGKQLYGDSKPVAGYAEEGVAEFVRLYVTNPAEAQRQAPTFFEHIENVFATEHPDVRDTLHKARADWLRYREQPAVARLLSQISIGENQTKPWTLSGLYRDAINDQHFLKVFENRMTKGEPPLRPSDSPSMLAQLYRSVGSKANLFLKEKPIDFDTFLPIPGAKSFSEIVEPFDRAGQLDDLDAYIAARSATDRIALGQETPFDPSDIKITLDTYNARPEFVQVAADLRTYEDHVLMYGRKEGFFSDEQIAAMRQRHPNHVPYMRVLEGNAEGGGAVANKKFANIANPVKQAKGGTGVIISPLESMVKNTYVMLSAFDRNEVGKKMVELAQSHEGMGKFVEEVPQSKIPVVLKRHEIAGMFESFGVESEDLDIPAAMAVAFRPNPKIPGMDNILSVRGTKEAGKAKLYQVHPDLYEALAGGLDRITHNLLIKALSAPASTLRVGATMLSPEFAIRNPFRDAWTAALYSQYGVINVPGAAFVRGVFNLMSPDDRLYQAWKAGGGEHAAMVSLDRASLQKTLREVIDSGKMRSIIPTVIFHPIDSMRALSEFTETATRLGEFAKSIEHEGGLTKDNILRAAFQSRDLLDYARQGAVVKAWGLNKLVAFLNAKVQGGDKFAREFKARPGLMMTRILATVAIPSLLLHLINKDDPRYEELPFWQKNLYWIFPGGSMDKETWAKMSASEKADFNAEHTIWRLPKPPDVGTLFGTSVERVIDWIEDNDPRSLKALGSGLLEMLPNPAAWNSLVPLVENMANWSFFRDRRLYPRGKEDVRPGDQYGAATSESAKALGDAVNYSPAKIENLARGWFGFPGQLGFSAADLALPSKIKGEQPDKTLADRFLVRAVVARFPGQPQSIERFYELYAKATQAKATFDDYKRQSPDKAREFAKENSKLIGDAKRLKPVAESLANGRKHADAVENSLTLSGAQKRRELDTITFRMMDMTSRVLKNRGQQIEPEQDRAVNE